MLVITSKKCVLLSISIQIAATYVASDSLVITYVTVLTRKALAEHQPAPAALRYSLIVLVTLEHANSCLFIVLSGLIVHL